MESSMNNTKAHSLADTISFWVILIALFALPVFLIPSALIPFQFGKTFFIYCASIVSAGAWVIARLREGKIGYIKQPILWLFGFIPLVFALSAIFSPARSVSLLGHGFEIGTFGFVFILFLIAFVVSEVFTSTTAGVYSYLAFLASFVIIALFQLVRLIVGPQFLSLGILQTATATLIGSWNDFGIYIGGVALFSFMSLELLRLERWLRSIFIGVLVVSIFFLSVVSFNAVWYTLAGFAIIFFVYRFTFAATAPENSAKRNFPMIPLVMLIISCVFILAQGNIYETLSHAPFNMRFLSRLAVGDLEVRPSIPGTVRIAYSTLKQHPILGTGPNRFVREWLVAKPEGVNESQYWNVDFNYGIGLIPTFLITVGPLGCIAWMAFIVLLLWLGFRALFGRRAEPFREYITVSSFIVALYFWIFMIIYVPSATLLFLTFFFTGLFLASLSDTELGTRRIFDFVKDPKTSFVSVLVFITLLLTALVSIYTISRKFVSAYYFNAALQAANVRGDIDAANNNLIRAIRFSEDDTYYRTLAQLDIIKINRLVSDKQSSPDVLQSQFRAVLGEAQSSAQAATQYDRTNYENWFTLGQVYETVLPFSSQEAYTNALSAYNQALKLNPRNPALYLVISRLEVAHNDLPKAKEYIAEALKLKTNYTDAIFFLSQIQASEGDLKSAIQSVQSAALISPNDPGVYFQLGLLRYNNKDYSGAVSAFEQAIRLVPNYANARYFLGLSYAKLNQMDKAIAEFEAIRRTNPDNKEIEIILTNLKAGRDPFANVQPPLDNKPEKRSRLPVQEKNPATQTSATDDR